MKKRLTVVLFLTLTVMVLTSCGMIFLPQSAKEHFGETDDSGRSDDCRISSDDFQQ